MCGDFAEERRRWRGYEVRILGFEFGGGESPREAPGRIWECRLASTLAPPDNSEPETRNPEPGLAIPEPAPRWARASGACKGCARERGYTTGGGTVSAKRAKRAKRAKS